MNLQHRGIVTLLRSAVTGEKLPLPEGFSVEASLEDIKRHNMVTLVYDGAVRCGISSGEPVMQQLFRSYCKALMVSEGQMREVNRIFAAFDENAIDYMPLKGCRMKALYPKPELRVMGDADILIRMEQYEKIVPIMKSLGFMERHESDHELIWSSSALFLELHKYVIPTYNKDFYAYFDNGWQLAAQKEGTRYSMTPQDEFIYLFTHFAKHYRDGGIGCRHVTDLWVFLRNHSGLDEAYIRDALEKLQLWEFYTHIRRLIAGWFEDGPMDEKTEFISEFIFASGSWGRMEDRMLSGAVKDAKRIPGSTGRVEYFLRLAFPGVEALKEKYTVLQKAPWMLPAVWAVRPIYKLLYEREGYKVHADRMAVMTPENLQSRQEALHYVGLDFHF